MMISKIAIALLLGIVQPITRNGLSVFTGTEIKRLRGIIGTTRCVERNQLAFVVCLAFVFCYGAVALAGEFTGVPKVHDGDTLKIGSTTIRLEGIDSPETDQICLNEKGARWTCGIEARDALIVHVARREIICTTNGIDIYKRKLGACHLGNEDLNSWLVQQGWALAYVKYSSEYRGSEKDAQTVKGGCGKELLLHRGTGGTATEKPKFLALLAFPLTPKKCYYRVQRRQVLLRQSAL